MYVRVLNAWVSNLDPAPTPEAVSGWAGKHKRKGFRYISFSLPPARRRKGGSRAYRRLLPALRRSLQRLIGYRSDKDVEESIEKRDKDQKVSK